MGSVDRSRIGCARRVHHVVDRIQSEGDVGGNPEDSVSAADDRLWRHRVSQPETRGQIGFREWEIAPRSGRDQKDVAHHWLKSLRQELIDVAGRVGIEVRKPVVALGPGTL